MPDSDKRYMVTAALLYANGPVHIGHLAGCYLPADIYVRYLRARRRDVCFVSGTDEHGVPVTLKAREENKSPQELVDHYHAHIQATLARFGIQFDIFDRTSRPEHHQLAQAFFKQLYAKGYLEAHTTEQYYDIQNQCFLPDRYIVGICVHCGYDSAYGDQCERCGRALGVGDLHAPRSRLGGEMEQRKTRNWYLPMDKWQADLRLYIMRQTHMRPHVKGQCMSWLDEGLRPRAMTRDLNWGVPVPLKDTKNKVLYVWFDAPIGYISATQQLFPTKWERYWKNKHTRLIHFIGKDNIVFHCLIFPLMLMLHGDYLLPDAVPANEFLSLEGEKISTSRNWAIWLHDYLDDFPNGQDTLRYVLCAKMPENKDSNFSWREFQALHNNELVSIYGNFVHRSLRLLHQYFQGCVPVPQSPLPSASVACLKEAEAIQKRLEAHIEAFAFRDALTTLMALPRLGHRFLASQAPWKQWPQHPEQVANVLYVATQLVARLTLLSEPFLPNTAQKLRKILGIPHAEWNNLPELKPKHRIENAKMLFQKIEDSVIETQIRKLNDKKLKT